MPKLRLVLLPLAILLVAAACSGGAASPTVQPTATQEASSPTPSPFPSPAVAPTPASVPLLFTALPDLGEGALKHAEVLAGDLGPRSSATEEEAAAAQYISQELASLGYEVDTQEFPVRRYDQTRPFLLMANPSARVIESRFINLTATGEVMASVVATGLGAEGDFPEEGMKGRIALIERGDFPFEEKVRNAQLAGASAAIIFNNEPGNFFGTLGTTSRIPALSISQEEGADLLSLLGEGDVVLDIRLLTMDVASRNVVATKPGSGANVVIIGAHYDTIEGIRGANDNASGVGVILTIADQIKEIELPFTVKFIAFGSEELGLLGSEVYLRSLRLGELASILAMINFDAVGSGQELITEGDQGLVETALRASTQMGIGISRDSGPPGSASDHDVFRLAGVPVIFFAGSDFSRVHTEEDTIEFVEAGLMGDAANLGLALIQSLANQ